MVSNYKIKMAMIKNILKDVNDKKNKHYKKYSKYRKINTLSKSGINLLNSISVCSLVLAFTPISPAVLILALTTTTISGVSSAGLSAFELEHKIHSHNTSYLQYTDLYRDVSARIRRNGLNSEDLDILLTEMNSRLGLIEDQSLPIRNSHNSSNQLLSTSPKIQNSLEFKKRNVFNEIITV